MQVAGSWRVYVKLAGVVDLIVAILFEFDIDCLEGRLRAG